VAASVPLRGERPAVPGGRTRRGQDPFAALVQGVADYAIVLLDRDGHVLTWNTGAERITGHAADEIIGRHVSVFYAKEDVANGAPGRDLGLATANGNHEDQGWRLRRDGSRFWASVSLTPLWSDGANRLRGFATVVRDDTERRLAAEERLRLEWHEAREATAVALHEEVVERLLAAGLVLHGARGLAGERPELVARLDQALDEVDGAIRHIRTTLPAIGGGGPLPS